jgi:hypothetical protein
MYLISVSVSGLAAVVDCAPALAAGKIIAAAKPTAKMENCVIERNEQLVRALIRPLGMTVLTRPNESPMNSFSSCTPAPAGWKSPGANSPHRPWKTPIKLSAIE